jgi:hypothetical protein
MKDITNCIHGIPHTGCYNCFNEKSGLRTMSEKETPKERRPSETWVNLYKDDNGRFLGDGDYGSKEMAEESADKLSTYVCAIRITDKSIKDEAEEQKTASIKDFDLTTKMRRAIGTYDNSFVISISDSCEKVAREAVTLGINETIDKAVKGVKDYWDEKGWPITTGEQLVILKLISILNEYKKKDQ